MHLRGVIFDLDDTLFDCTGQLTGPARRRAAEQMQTALPDLSLEDLCACQTRLADTFGSSGAIQEIGRRHALPRALVEAALRAYNQNAVETISPFPGTLPTLQTLLKRQYRLGLVTTGNPDRQRRKVRQLGLSSFFDENRSTFVLHDDRQDPHKDAALVRAAGHLSLSPGQILTVGDKLTAEIAAGNRLGMVTVRLRHGRQKDRRPQTPEERPDYEIDTLLDLLDLLP